MNTIPSAISYVANLSTLYYIFFLIFTLLLVCINGNLYEGTGKRFSSCEGGGGDCYLKLREESRKIFYHGFNSYMKYAYPWDELKPLSCTGRKWNERERGTLDDSLGGFSTTLVDSLDMFALIGDYAGFRKYVRMVINDVHFNRNVNVSVFETNIITFLFQMTTIKF